MTISITSPTSTTSKIQQNGNDVLTVDSSNNVTVINNLSVSGTVTASGNINFDSNTLYVDAANNKVGIGTGSPGEILHLNATTAPALKIESSAGSCYVVNRSSDSGMELLNAMNGPMEFYTNNTEKMRITSSGNVGIGTSSPATPLHTVQSGQASVALFQNTNASWAGDVQVAYAPNGSTASILGFSARSDGSTWTTSNYGDMLFITGTSGSGFERMRIQSNGYVLMGTTSAGSPYVTQGFGFLTISGSYMSIGHASGTANGQPYAVFAYNGSSIGYIGQNTTSTVSYNTSSDYRLKENIQPMTGGLDKVLQLNPVTWTWKSDGASGQGFIAHEAKAVVPDCVMGEKDAVDNDGNPVYQGIDTSFLVATLTKAIQEQQDIIKALETRIQALENPS